MTIELEYSPGVRARRREQGLAHDHRFLVPSTGAVRDSFAFHDLTSRRDGAVVQLSLSNLAIVTLDATVDPAEALHCAAERLWPGLAAAAEDLLTIIDSKVLNLIGGSVAGRIFAGEPSAAEPFIEHVELDSRIFLAEGLGVDFQYLIDFYGEKMRPGRIPTYLELCRRAYADVILPRAFSLYPNTADLTFVLGDLYPGSVREK